MNREQVVERMRAAQAEWMTDRSDRLPHEWAADACLAIVAEETAELHERQRAVEAESAKILLESKRIEEWARPWASVEAILLAHGCPKGEGKAAVDWLLDNLRVPPRTPSLSPDSVDVAADDATSKIAAERDAARAEVERLRAQPPCAVDVDSLLAEYEAWLDWMEKTSEPDVPMPSKQLSDLIRRHTRAVDVEAAAEELCAANYPGGVDSEVAAEIILRHLGLREKDTEDAPGGCGSSPAGNPAPESESTAARGASREQEPPVSTPWTAAQRGARKPSSSYEGYGGHYGYEVRDE